MWVLNETVLNVFVVYFLRSAHTAIALKKYCFCDISVEEENAGCTIYHHRGSMWGSLLIIYV